MSRSITFKTTEAQARAINQLVSIGKARCASDLVRRAVALYLAGMNPHLSDCVNAALISEKVKSRRRADFDL